MAQSAKQILDNILNQIKLNDMEGDLFILHEIKSVLKEYGCSQKYLFVISTVIENYSYIGSELTDYNDENN